MASNNLTMPQFDQWQPQFNPTFNNTYENDCFTNALYKSYTNLDNNNSSDDNVFTDLIDSIVYNQPPAPTVQTPLTPTFSTASENDVPALKRRRTGVPAGRVSKRKSRASKRSMTTFITTDPANFRQMVQEVTGVRFDGEASAFKPEPLKMMQQQQQPGFDTSSFLLDSPFPGNGGAGSSYNNCNNYYNGEMAQPTVTRGGGGGFGFDSFCSFPTLESWKV